MVRERNRARTAGAPGRLADARSSGIVEIELEMEPQAAQEHSPASVMMLARDFWHTDFAIGQTTPSCSSGSGAPGRT